MWSRRQWIQLGFQQKDPASDLRGAGTHGRSTMRRSPQPAALAPTVAGIAGVRHLTCFLRSHAAEYRAAAAAGPDHCVALASLNQILESQAPIHVTRHTNALYVFNNTGVKRRKEERSVCSWRTGGGPVVLENQRFGSL